VYERQNFKYLLLYLDNMADVGIFTKNADIQARAGINANTTSKAVAATDVYVLNVESFINVATRYNWSDAYSGLNADVKGILTDIGSCLCAIYVIQSDISGFTSRGEAESMITILRDIALRGIAILRDKKSEDFINGA